MKWIKVYSTKDEVEANIIKHKLENSGIPCQLFNIDSSRIFAEINEKYLSGIEVVVPEEFLGKSKKIIQDTEDV